MALLVFLILSSNVHLGSAVRYETNIVTNTGTTLSYGISAEAEWELTQDVSVDIWLNVTHIVFSIIQMTISGIIFVSFDSPVCKVQCNRSFQKTGISKPVEIYETLIFSSGDFEAEFKSEKDLGGTLSYSITIKEEENTGIQFTYNVAEKAFRISVKRTVEDAIGFMEDQKNKIAISWYIPLLALWIIVLFRKKLQKRPFN